MIQAIMAVLFAQHVIACTPPGIYVETCWPPTIYIPSKPPRCEGPDGKEVDLSKMPMILCGQPIETTK